MGRRVLFCISVILVGTVLLACSKGDKEVGEKEKPRFGINYNAEKGELLITDLNLGFGLISREVFYYNDINLPELSRMSSPREIIDSVNQTVARKFPLMNIIRENYKNMPKEHRQYFLEETKYIQEGKEYYVKNELEKITGKKYAEFSENICKDLGVLLISSNVVQQERAFVFLYVIFSRFTGETYFLPELDKRGEYGVKIIKLNDVGLVTLWQDFMGGLNQEARTSLGTLEFLKKNPQTSIVERKFEGIFKASDGRILNVDVFNRHMGHYENWKGMEEYHKDGTLRVSLLNE